MASLEQYFALLINFTVLVIMARILTPGEIGEAVTGLAIAVVAFSAREFVTSEFLIQRGTVDVETLRTALTLQVAVSVMIAAVLVALSCLITRFYAAPDLSFFLSLAAVAGVVEALAQPVIALLRREMGFGVLACIRTAVSLTAALATIILASLGFGPIARDGDLPTGSCTLARSAELRPVQGRSPRGGAPARNRAAVDPGAHRLHDLGRALQPLEHTLRHP